MLNTLITQWPRTKGNGWDKAKVHEQLHVLRDISRNGSPRESYGGPLEHNHLPMKALSKCTQRRRDVHDSQLATRIAESYIINTAHSAMNKTQYADNKEMDEIPKIDGISKGSALGILTLTHGGNGRNLHHTFSWKTKQLIGKNLEICFSEGAIQCIIDYVKDDFFHPTSPTNILNLEMYTKYKRHNIIFWAHPCYHTCTKPWYNWAIFHYE